MSSLDGGRHWLATAAISVLVAVAALVMMASRGGVSVPVDADPAAADPVAQEAERGFWERLFGSSEPEPAGHLVDEEVIGAVTTAQPVEVRGEPSSEAPGVSVLREGILLPVLAVHEGFVQVMTPCEITGWVEASLVHTHLRASGAPSSLDEATILIDPGHGGSLLPGAVGPTGLTEAKANLETSLRLLPKLAGARAFLTRNDDFMAGIPFRTELADRLGAHAFLSVHYNAAPDIVSDVPGTETYYQVNSEASKRLAGLLYEDLYHAVAPYDVSWVANQDAGAKYRINQEGRDIYGVLRRPAVPSVLVETMFISNAPEEALLYRPEVHEDVATAIARALERYFTTDDPGSGYVESQPTKPPSSGRLPSACVDPA